MPHRLVAATKHRRTRLNPTGGAPAPKSLNSVNLTQSNPSFGDLPGSALEASVPIAKFVTTCRLLSANFAIDKDTSEVKALVWRYVRKSALRASRKVDADFRTATLAWPCVHRGARTMAALRSNSQAEAVDVRLPVTMTGGDIDRALGLD